MDSSCSELLDAINEMFNLDSSDDSDDSDESEGHTPTRGDPGHCSVKSEVSSGHDKGHIMISYQHASQQRMLRVRNYLVERGYNVWMDVDNMEGDILESMAKGVERASVILVCMSHKFKESKNCKAEAGYAHALGKHIVPLMLEDKFVPTAWLGPLVGMKKYFPMFSDDLMKQQLPKLLKELGDKGKHGGKGASNPTAHDQIKWKGPAKGKEIDWLQGLDSWDEKEALGWLIKNGVDTSMW
ncbi:uncharacterized protein LOC105439384 [Strongylocentrotus purpuratus]|uniref:TIR domain-containing protein n=1 Tax=Strongylocentrotus purpuratus TaxID=7668 RepID=A0A7M7LVT8_STRPU|nr:uncharacterized protein LOC105439384 [Strongylocentrotus purpuratus]|eukprot:XP_011666616.1 PREDICTED: uncharacterized protein LOC105439384 [Strongylocentrotus purpuratus]